MIPIPVRRFQKHHVRSTRGWLWQPGARESYSNTGFSVLAAIIEQVTVTTYDVYVRDAITAPPGLRRTGFLLPKFGLKELAHG